MTAVEILTEAKALVAGGWTQGEYARNGYGNPVRPGHPDACTWCMVGALRKAKGTGRSPDMLLSAQRFLEDAADTLHLYNGMTLPAWNDAPDRTQADVLAAFDRAIASAGGER